MCGVDREKKYTPYSNFVLTAVHMMENMQLKLVVHFRSIDFIFKRGRDRKKTTMRNKVKTGIHPYEVTLNINDK